MSEERVGYGAPTNPRVVVFASGAAEPGHGGSGFRKLVEATRSKPKPLLRANIVGVVSNHADGGVHDIAHELGVRFVHLCSFDAAAYKAVMHELGAKWAALSGWIKRVHGLDPRFTFNIHPAPLPRFGGMGFYGLRPHREVVAAFDRREVAHTAVTMHFVTDGFDEGPTFFHLPIELQRGETPEQLQGRVNAQEHAWQAVITNMVLHGRIRWNGEVGSPVRVSPGYHEQGFCPDSCVVYSPGEI